MSELPKNDPLEALETLAFSIIKVVGSIWSIIIHTVIFIGAFSLVFFGIKLELVLLVLTTILSLEAIYLSIFIQMTVNRNTRAIEATQKDIDEIQEDVEEIAEDVEEIAEDVEEIQEDVEEIAEDVEEIQEDVEELQDDEVETLKEIK